MREWMPSVPITNSAATTSPPSKSTIAPFSCSLFHAHTLPSPVHFYPLPFDLPGQLFPYSGPVDSQGREIVFLLRAVEEFTEDMSSTVSEGELFVAIGGSSQLVADASVVHNTESIGARERYCGRVGSF
jgi:hypothetical protein